MKFTFLYIKIQKSNFQSMEKITEIYLADFNALKLFNECPQIFIKIKTVNTLTDWHYEYI